MYGGEKICIEDLEDVSFCLRLDDRSLSEKSTNNVMAIRSKEIRTRSDSIQF